VRGDALHQILASSHMTVRHIKDAIEEGVRKAVIVELQSYERVEFFSSEKKANKDPIPAVKTSKAHAVFLSDPHWRYIVGPGVTRAAVAGKSNNPHTL
jgi:hypothetical protein